MIFVSTLIYWLTVLVHPLALHSPAVQGLLEAEIRNITFITEPH